VIAPSVSARVKLEEFPLALLVRACPKELSQATYTAVAGGRSLSLSMSGAPGRLPTGGNMARLLALVLTYQKGAMDDRAMEFESSQLIRLMGQSLSGDLYGRIEAALSVWTDTAYVFESKDAAGSDKPYRASFRILDSCAQLPDKRWRIQWSDPVWLALLQGAWSGLDAQVLLKLKPLSRQLYCFLSSRFRTTASLLSIDLHELCFEHIGIFRSVPTRRLFEMVRKACADLEAAKVLKPREPRVEKRSKGEWNVAFENPVFSTG
jgi:hypothetical protein